MTVKTLYTIGYEGTSREEFLAHLERAAVNLLIDVRDVPISRKKGFSKHGLSDALRSKCIDYLHLKGLGDPKPGRIAAREGRIDAFRQIFNAHLRSASGEADLERGIRAARDRYACLMCFERNHENCHRCIVAEEMARRAGFRLIDLSAAPVAASRSRPKNASLRHATPVHVG